MKKLTHIKSIVLSFLLFGLVSTIQAQEEFQLSPQGLELKVTGTSSLHDWHMTSNKATGSAKITLGNISVTMTNLTITMDPKSLKSGKGGMDENAYKALKTKDFPTITFKLDKVETSGEQMIAHGMLTLAGETRAVSLKGTYTASTTQVTFAGAAKFKLTDFNITPPTALLGTVKTGNDVGIEVKSTFIVKK